MAIIQCRSCGHEIEVDGIVGFPQACHSCGSRTVRIALGIEDLDADTIERILAAVPDVPPDEGDEIPGDINMEGDL